MKRNERAFQLISEKESLERKLKDATRELEQIQRTCRHEWGETKYDPVIKEAYTIPGDPPGTMGVDWRGPTHVPRQEKKRWKRVCPVCGLVEYTEKATERITSVPSF